MNKFELHLGDCLERLKEMPDNSVQCVVTSPPYYGLRDYGVDGQIGLEETPDAYVAKMVDVFREVRRVLREDGTCWVNLGDSYNVNGRDGHGTRVGYKQGTNRASSTKQDLCRPTDQSLKPKDLIGIPWRVAFALQADGWYLRQDIIWHKPNPMPESVRDRCTKAHEYIFLLTKSARYFYDAEAVKEEAVKGSAGSLFYTGKTGEHQLGRSSQKPRISDDRKDLRCDIESRHRSSIKGGQSLQVNPDGKRNRRSVWTVATKPFKEAHFAVFPPKLIEPCILAGCPEGGIVLDPFTGSGTTGIVALENGRRFVGVELNPEYHAIAQARIEAAARDRGRKFALLDFAGGRGAVQRPVRKDERVSML